MSGPTLTAAVLLSLAAAAAMLPASKRLMQYFQLGSYQFGAYARSFIRQLMKCLWPGLALGLAAALLSLAVIPALRWPSVPAILFTVLMAALILLAGYVIGLLTYRERKVKTRLVITARVRRLSIALFAEGLLLSFLLLRLTHRFWIPALIPLLMPMWLFLAALITWPVEKGIQMLYRKDAKGILDHYRASGLAVIGITGSYGKTTVKNLLAAMLSQRYPTLATPASFNTPMGLARCIREELGQQHLFFIAEMGARHPWDIRVLSRLIRPDAGILTSIGPQHLQTMGSIERIGRTKYDLIRGLPKHGFAVFNFDGKYVSGYYEKTSIPKALAGIPGSDLWAEDLDLFPEGSRFTLCLPSGERLACETRLAGDHNIRNILLAALMAMHYGITPEEIRNALISVNPPASRLQVTTCGKGYKVINNGFNSNPDSSRKALQVLSSYPGRHVVVTPGFIELGRQEEQSNRRLGSDIAAVAQMALLVGEKHTRPIREGLLENGMAEENVHVFASLAQANEFVQENCGPGDVVLYENDLPDHYS